MVTSGLRNAKRPMVLVALVVATSVVGVVFVATPVAADMHAACDTYAGQNVEAVPAGPIGYGNVELLNDPRQEGLTYSAQLYCPGAVFSDLELAVVDADTDTTVAALEPDACAATASEPCTFSATTTLEPGTYWVELEYDANDPDTDGLEYNDRKRTQRFEWAGSGQPVVTCPDAGYVHFTPPCPTAAP